MRVDVRRADAIFRGMVARVMAEEQVGRMKFSDESGFSEPHLRRVIDDPGAARLRDLRGIADAYGVTDEEIVGIVRGARC